MGTLNKEPQMTGMSADGFQCSKTTNKTMREITSHRVNLANDTLSITVNDDAGAGGANHSYSVFGFHTQGNKSATAANDDETALHLLFQNGPIAEAGVNGITQEVLLAIVQDRLEAFQAGPYATEENARALSAVKEAQHWLQFRTLKRMARGVEGTHAK